MIKFNAKIMGKKKYKSILKMSDTERLKYDVPLYILIDNQVFFCEQDFPIFDFLFAVYKWRISENDEDFFYNCIETEDNPLISFILDKGKWKISSPWQFFECRVEFEKEELINALDTLEKTMYL